MRVAYVSPLPPERSGIADYSAELLPQLAAAGAELELFWEGRERPVEALRRAFACRPARELPAALATRGFEAVVYQLGNSADYHSEAWRLLREHPGVVVLHEYVLHHLVRDLTLVRGDFAGYLDEMRYCAGPTGLAAARRAIERQAPVDPFSFPLFERVVDRSHAVLVHSEFTRRRLLASRPRARVGVVPHLLLLADGAGAVSLPKRAELRRAWGVPEDAFVLASFGHVTPQKHLMPPLAAFARLRREVPSAVYLIVGEVSPHYDLAGQLAAKHLGDGVRVTGRVSLRQLHEAMALADVAVNLRHPTGGESSGSLLRLLGLGTPTIVTDGGSFAELPAGCVVKVAVDDAEEEVLLALFQRLRDDAELRGSLGASAQQWVAEACSAAAVAREYMALLRQTANATAPALPPPPLAAHAEGDLAVRLVSRVASGFADLGLAEDDAPVLAAVAEAMADLRLDGRSHPWSGTGGAR